jgi:hypothetical protein
MSGGEPLTRGLAIVGAVTGLLALVWQMYVRSTDRPRLYAYIGLFSLISVGVPDSSEEWLVVDVVNRGRLAAFIDGMGVEVGRAPYQRRWPDRWIKSRLRRVVWKIRKPKERALLLPLPFAPDSLSAAMSPKLPKRLEPGERAKFFVLEVVPRVKETARKHDGRLWCRVDAPGSPCRARLSARDARSIMN